MSAPAFGETLVSLGDSFSSGEGAGSYDANTNNKDGVKRNHKCHRSSNAWPRFLGVAQEHHLACSGARRRHLTTGQTDKAPDDTGQIQRLRALAEHTHFDRVLLTMGGNDIGFASRITHCYAAGTIACLNNLGDIKRDLAAMKPRLTEDYRAIMSAARAPLLVVGYPDIAPQENAKTTGCSGWMTKRDRKRAAELIAALDKTFREAASDAGADFVSLADVLRGHELCSEDAWVQKLHAVPSLDQQQGHPLLMGQLAMAARVRTWLKRHRGACTPSNNVAAVIDDSGSMLDNDPEGIRGRAIELLLSKPAAQNRVFGAVEFAGAAQPLFAPATVSASRTQMLGALGALQNDGIGENDVGGTDYNVAIRASAAAQPQATARIFLTDGAHNAGEYEDVHAGGPPTHVIGLNIGRAGEGNEDADRLQRIANETGGTYFPLRLQSSDTPEQQVSRLQGVVNDIDAKLTCATGATTTPTTLAKQNKASPIIRSLLTPRQRAVEVVLSWGTATADVDLRSAAVRNRKGRVIADLKGRKRTRKHARRTKLRPSVIEGQTFDIVTFALPRRGRTLSLRVAAPTLPTPVEVTVQTRAVRRVGPPGQTPVGSPVPTPTPVPTPSPTPVPHVRVNAYSNYGSATAGHAMCRGNPGAPSSMPGGTATQTFAVPPGVGVIDSAKVQIDPASSVTATATLTVNGLARATATSTAVGDTNFSFPEVPVAPGDQAALAIRFSATSGTIITVYSAASVGGQLTLSNSCPAGAPSLTTPNGLRAVISGWNR
jgi:hypothetical protein